MKLNQKLSKKHTQKTLGTGHSHEGKYLCIIFGVIEGGGCLLKGAYFRELTADVQN